MISLYGGEASLPGVAAPAAYSANTTSTPAINSTTPEQDSTVTLPVGSDTSKAVSQPAGVSPASPATPQDDPSKQLDGALSGDVTKTGTVSLTPKTPGEKAATSMKTPGEVSQIPITPTAAGAVNVIDSSKGYTDNEISFATAKFEGENVKGRVYFAPPQNDTVKVQVDLLGLPKGNYFLAIHSKPVTHGCNEVGGKNSLMHLSYLIISSNGRIVHTQIPFTNTIVNYSPWTQRSFEKTLN